MRRTLGVRSGLVRGSRALDSSFQGKLTASDAASGDEFGWSVALYGSTAVVGAPFKNSRTGAAYVFVDSASGWSQQAKLVASDAALRDEFGFSVALYGSTAVVGAPGDNSGAGAAYVFVHSASGWSQQAKLTASDAASGDSFGFSVALSGSTAVVGAPNKSVETGAAYVLVHSASGWSQQAKLTASDAASGDSFGFSVAVSGSTAVVGAPDKNSATGEAYVFGRSGITWPQRATLTASDAASGDSFGNSVAIRHSTLVVGAPGTNSRAGDAYVFEGSGSTWSQQAELTASDAGENDDFGWSVALYGSTVVVGAPDKPSGLATGAAYAFVNSASGWSQRSELLASPGASGDQFGRSVGVSGSIAVVGAFGNHSHTGAAYAFVLPSQQAELTGSDAASGDGFGTSVAISGSTAVVGDPGNNNLAGAAYVFVHSASGWSQQAKLTGASNDRFGFSVAIYGSTALVGAVGANSFAGAAYVFVRSGSTWSQQAKLTVSDAASVELGSSVAIYGQTAVVSAQLRNLDTGAAYVFVHSASGWSQQAKLTASDGTSSDSFGHSVAVYGSTAVVGAPGRNNGAGAAYAFARSGSTWSQQARLTGASNDSLGYSVALYGSTALIGAPGDNSNAGAAYVFGRSGSTWSRQAKLTASNAASGDSFGWSVALYGSTALIGAPDYNSVAGAAYAFTQSGTAWSQTPSDAASNDFFGNSVALYGSNALIGAPGNNSDTGAAYVFTPN